MKKIFKNKNSQIRSGWKIAGAYTSFMIFTTMASFVIMVLYSIYQLVVNKLSPDDLINLSSEIDKSLTNLNGGLGLLLGIVQCLCMILVVVLFWKILEKRPLKEIGLINIKKGNRDLLYGLAFGAISLVLTFILLLVSGNVTLVNSLLKPNFNLSLITGLVLFIFVGINEEMFSRGYCMAVLRQTRSRYAVVIVSSVIFAFMHSLNPGMSLFAYINLFLFGLLTAYMTIKSGNLWLSIGYHITWNYFEGNICGFLVSGQTTDSMYSLKVTTYNLINGGKFGPEGGVIVTFILILSFLYLWKIYKPSCEALPGNNISVQELR